MEVFPSFFTSSDSGSSSTSASPCPSAEDPLVASLHRLPGELAQQFSPPLSELDSAYMSSSTSSPLGSASRQPPQLWSAFESTSSGLCDLLEKTVQPPPRLFENNERRLPASASTIGCQFPGTAQMMPSKPSTTRFGHPSGCFHEQRRLGDASPGMRDVPQWLKSLRLHKYTPMFAPLDYDQMMALDEAQLETHNVTKGARRKILQSIQKLRERPQTLLFIEQNIGNAVELRGSLMELRGMVQSPIRFHTIGQPEDHPDNLPGLIVRVLARVHAAVFELQDVDDDHYAVLLNIYDRLLGHEAFTAAQKQRIGAWKRAVRKVFSPAQLRKQRVSPAMCNPTTAAYFMGAAAAFAASQNAKAFDPTNRWPVDTSLTSDQLKTIQNLFTQMQQQIAGGQLQAPPIPDHSRPRFETVTPNSNARQWHSAASTTQPFIQGNKYNIRTTFHPSEPMEHLAANLAAVRPPTAAQSSRRASCVNLAPESHLPPQHNSLLRRSATIVGGGELSHGCWTQNGPQFTTDPFAQSRPSAEIKTEYGAIGTPSVAEQAARIASRMPSSGYASSSGSDRSSGAGSPPGLMVYNFGPEMDRICRSVAELAFENSSAGDVAGTAFH